MFTLPIPALLATLTALQTVAGTCTGSDLQSCPSDLPFSCQNSSAVHNSCCFEAPGGTLLQTQFWDTDPSTGPSDSWTIHGLWYLGTHEKPNH